MAHPFPNPPYDTRGNLHHLHHESDTLKSNPWNDPYLRDLWVYTPKGYDEGSQSYPILIFYLPMVPQVNRCLREG